LAHKVLYMAKMPSVETSPEFANRKRFSSSDSARPLMEGKPRRAGPMRHQLWLPDTDTGPEPKGMLAATALLDYNGRIENGISLPFDRHYYKLASSLARMHYAGFAPVLNAMGIQVDYGQRSYFYDQQYYINATFPPTETFVAMGNGVLEKCGAELRLTRLPPGYIQTETFLDMLSDGQYPLSGCHPTPDKEQDSVEYGAHDMLLHSPALVALAVTDGFGHLKSRARALRDGSAFSEADTEDSKRRKLGAFMRNTDSGINVIEFAGLLENNRGSQIKFGYVGDIVPYGEAWNCRQQVINTLRDPLSHGFTALAGEVQ